MTEKEKIKHYLKTKGISKNKFYTATGLSQGFLDSGNTIGVDKAKIIINCYQDINLEWFILDKGDMINERTKFFVSETPPTYNLKGVPLVEQEAVGGFGNDEFAINSTDIVERYVIPDFVDSSFIIRVRGNSMSPRYLSGDMVACKILKESSFIQWNEIHVISTREQGILIKRIKECDNKECFVLVSENPEFPPFKVPKEEITGIAIVLGGVRIE